MSSIDLNLAAFYCFSHFATALHAALESGLKACICEYKLMQVKCIIMHALSRDNPLTHAFSFKLTVSKLLVHLFTFIYSCTHSSIHSAYSFIHIFLCIYLFTSHALMLYALINVAFFTFRQRKMHPSFSFSRRSIFSWY